VDSERLMASRPAGTRDRTIRLSPWLTYSPAILSVLLMVPRLVSAQFGLFDDGFTLMTVRRILWGEWTVFQVPWEVAAGRLRPTYWLLPIGIDLLAGKDPFWFYLANTVLLSATVVGLIWLVRLTGGSRVRSALTGLLFAVAGPVVESYYTLSKGEAIQAACLVASLVLITYWARAQTRLTRVGWWLAVLLALLLAVGSKETGLAILPIAAGWLVLGGWRLRHAKDRHGLGVRVAYLAAAAMASFVFVGVLVALRGGGIMQGGYSSHYAIDVPSLEAVAVRWSGWLVRDFSYLLPLGVVALVAGVLRRPGSSYGPLLDSFVWMGVWVIVFLPWGRYTVEYYMLPFAIGAAGFGAAAAELALQSIASVRGSWRGVAILGMALSGLLWVLTLPTSWSNARVQLAVDGANADVLRFIAAQAPKQSQVLINIQDPNEYVVEFGLSLSEFDGRSDLVAVPIQLSDPGLGAYDDGPTFLVVPEVQNTPKLSVRMGVIDDTQRLWNEGLMAKVQGRSVAVFKTERALRLVAFDSPRLACTFFRGTDYCSGQSPVFDTREFTYGWRVYRLE
jgi:hypothetical protein